LTVRQVLKRIAPSFVFAPPDPFAGELLWLRLVARDIEIAFRCATRNERRECKKENDAMGHVGAIRISKVAGDEAI
jgi:hypothetical protein